MATTDPLEDVRDWVGSQPDDPAVYAALARWDGDPLRAAQSILRRRLADLEEQYAAYSVSGDASWRIDAGQIAAVKERLSRLGAQLGDTLDQTTSGLPVVTTTTLGLPADEGR